MEKEIFANKIKQFHMLMWKQILGVKKFTNNIEVLLKLWRTPLKIDIKTKMFKYFQRFPFIETIDSKPSKKKNLMQKTWFRVWNPYLTGLD